MWKIFVGFIAFAVLALFIVMKGGDKIDMQGEAGGHSLTESHSASATSSATVTLSSPTPNAPAASASK